MTWLDLKTLRLTMKCQVSAVLGALDHGFEDSRPDRLGFHREGRPLHLHIQLSNTAGVE